jgi:predicted phosphodiesterase
LAWASPEGRRWNPGSLTLPKKGFPPSYGLYRDGRFQVLSLTGELIVEDAF